MDAANHPDPHSPFAAKRTSESLAQPGGWDVFRGDLLNSG
jgi:hypothetical protein